MCQLGDRNLTKKKPLSVGANKGYRFFVSGRQAILGKTGECTNATKQ